MTTLGASRVRRGAMLKPESILCPSPQGLYCPPGDFYVDPTRPVARAVITHGHSDHARGGHGAVLATVETLAIMRARYGDEFAGSAEAVRYGQATEQIGRASCRESVVIGVDAVAW